MSEPFLIDFIMPSVGAILITALWAGCALPLTYFVAKGAKNKVLALVSGWVASLSVMITAIMAGGFASLVYWSGFKGVDFNALFHPAPLTPAYAPFFDGRVRAMVAPIISALASYALITRRWKRAGAKLGVT